MVDAEPHGGAEAPAASGGDGVARPPRQRRRHSRLGQRRPTAAPSARSALLKLKMKPRSGIGSRLARAREGAENG